MRRCTAAIRPAGIERLDGFQTGQFFHQIEQIAAIAIGHGAQAGARIVGQLAAVSP